MPTGIYKHKEWQGFKKGNIPWIKGKTKKTNNRIKAPSTCYKKGNISPCGMLGKFHTKETKEKQKHSLNKHHIWYEDNDGNPTEKGIWFVTNRRHAQIHQLLKYNRWIDNRRYLAG